MGALWKVMIDAGGRVVRAPVLMAAHLFALGADFSPQPRRGRKPPAGVLLELLGTVLSFPLREPLLVVRTLAGVLLLVLPRLPLLKLALLLGSSGRSECEETGTGQADR